MRTASIASVVVAVLLAVPAPAAAQKSDSKVKVSAKADKPDAQGKQIVTITLTMDKGWHTYANPAGNDLVADGQTAVKVAANGKALDAKVDYPAGKLVSDKVTGDYRVYEDQVTIKATVQRPAGPLEVSVTFQACNDQSCLPPATVKVAVP